MTDVIRHRGPDADGIYVHGSLGLGHRRLSIIDLSEAEGSQCFPTTGIWRLFFNGEFIIISIIEMI
jgi:asparagine synthase (glutamine-hydrolysing)